MDKKQKANAATLGFEKVGRNVLQVKMDGVRDGWEQWFLLTSDRHHDSIHSDRRLAVEHLEKARERKAKVLDFGDFFDAMQGKYDPRRSYPDMNPLYLRMMEKERIGYLDAIVKDAVEMYEPYADLFMLISKGNHETAISSHNDTDLTNRLVYGLNAKGGTRITTGEYGGWVQFFFKVHTTTSERVNLKYFHGSGGGGPVTKGVIQSNRQAVYLPDAQIVVNGHIHETWVLTLQRERVNSAGTIFQDTQTHVRTGTYKDEYGDGSGGWAVEKGMPPKPLGAVWLHFYYSMKHIRYELIQDVQNGSHVVKG